GLTQADAGRVVLRGKDVTGDAPQRRGVGMVFQQYALFGHMSVADNVEFPLKIRRVDARERARRRDQLLELVGLVGYQRRFPIQLSGGQQQRVALARALAHNPQVLLLDEPFGALDARIRTELRRNLQEIRRELRVTTIFVTHDQEEAVELADRLGVMNFGRLLEVGTADELYLRPKTEFVATFLGKANLFVGECSADEVKLGAARFPLETRSNADPPQRRVQVLFRPEDVAVKLTRDALDWPLLGEAVVENVEFAGSSERLRLRMPAEPGVRAIAPAVPFGADYLLVDATRSQHLARRYPLAVGDRAWIGVRRLHALAHRGLSFAVVDRGRFVTSGAIEYAGTIARLCHARVSIVVSNGHGAAGVDRAQAARERLGSGLASVTAHGVESESRAFVRELDRIRPDLVVVPRVDLDERFGLEDLLAADLRSVLVARAGASAPRRVILCTAAGDAAKADIVVAGRILRHFGSPVTILTVVQPGDPVDREQLVRFHDLSRRTLQLHGLDAVSEIVDGEPREWIARRARDEGHDLVVLGAPPAEADARTRFTRQAIELTDQVDIPLLIVNAGEAA
ncbi:MAG TPA: ATP-binding cassette domain-containing protein, partial [Candidatus Polarisedimenticolaceae bacterium]|nr:ATP-binding cassette domain-containing protein [Candidatus Polarisedimenticolaceae bacterium]